ncbi:MAG: hypothetical protein J07HQX50_01715 [Haloquadratum sp. J07HQX50]|nr:MAG: hypothetical protein J07HQX50_01715 [Haloquadratum sp. J07HQX50]
MDYHNHLDIDPDDIIGEWEQTEPTSPDVAFAAIRDASTTTGRKKLNVCRTETNTFYWKLDQTIQADGYRTWITSHQSASMDVASISETVGDVLHEISNTDTYAVNCIGVDEFEDGYEFIALYSGGVPEGITDDIANGVVDYVLNDDTEEKEHQGGNGGPNGNVEPLGTDADASKSTADDHQTFREDAQTVTIDVFPRTPDRIARVSADDTDTTNDSSDTEDTP